MESRLNGSAANDAPDLSRVRGINTVLSQLPKIRLGKKAPNAKTKHNNIALHLILAGVFRLTM
jgi:hypothetical protein